MRTIALPSVVGAERAAWHLVLDLAEAGLPRWVLAGGLMVHLHLHEAGATPTRVTTDVDAIVDVSIRSRHATEEFSRLLEEELDLRLEQPDADGVAHRFRRRDGVVVDVLAADFGPRSRPHLTIAPARTVEVPGGRSLLDSAEPVLIEHEGRSARIERPSLRAAIIGKGRAFTDIASPTGDPERHLRDAAALLAVLDPDSVTIRAGDRRHLTSLRERLTSRPRLAGDDLDAALDTLGLLVRR